MKKQLNPKMTALILTLTLCIVGYVLWSSTAGGGNLPTGTTLPGNAGPFAPGGVANGKGGSMPKK